MEEMICVTCPLGCRLSIERISETEIGVSGNKCARGEQYAREELLSPRRTVTATCGIKAGSHIAVSGGAVPSGAVTSGTNLYSSRRVPVRTTGAFPRERVGELLELVYKTQVVLPVRRGDVVIADALGTGIDVIAARSM